MACQQADGVCWQSHAARRAFLPGFGSSRACRRIRGGLIPEIKAWVLAEGRFLLLATAGGTLLEQAKPRKNRIIFFSNHLRTPQVPWSLPWSCGSAPCPGAEHCPCSPPGIFHSAEDRLRLAPLSTQLKVWGGTWVSKWSWHGCPAVRN